MDSSQVVWDTSSEGVELHLEALVQEKREEGEVPVGTVHCRQHAGEREETQVLVPVRVVAGSEEEGFVTLHRIVCMGSEGAVLCCM